MISALIVNDFGQFLPIRDAGALHPLGDELGSWFFLFLSRVKTFFTHGKEKNNWTRRDLATAEA